MNIVIGVITLLVIDIVLSIDNVILIVSSTQRIENKKQQKTAQIIGGIGAIIMRLIFVILVMFAFDKLEDINFIYIFSGILLAYISFGLFKDKDKNANQTHKKASNNVIKAIILIMVGDVMMSFDNAIVIAGISQDITNTIWVNISIVIIALMISLVIILFFANYLTILMQKHQWIKKLGAWLLLALAIELFFKDAIFNFESWESVIAISHFQITVLSHIASYVILEIFFRWCSWNKIK